MKAELLAPAGSLEGLQAVVKAGADAAYIGGSLFGARAYAKNAREEQLLEAIDYAHLHGVKLYLTVNTLLKNSELYGELFSFLAPYYARGIDAVIVQDLGVLSFLKKEFPGLPIHASTQMTITGPHGARLLKEAGASRIVTARELSLEEINRIYTEMGIEIESFVHGALCYCYSGMCLFSSMLGGRSGNRGRCAQPCRLPYTAYSKRQQINDSREAYLLSPKDMCTVELLPEILKAGVYSLKIEGRMKRPEYAAGVTAIYRKYLNLYEQNPEEYRVSREDMQQLLDLYQRDGFNQGYYHIHNGRSMMAVVNQKEQDRKRKIQGKRNEELFADLKAAYLDTKKQEKINGNLILFADSPAILDLDFQEIHVQVSGDTVEKAVKQPLSAQRVKKQLEKTGQTPFVFENLEIITDEACFMPMQSLNALRRQGLEKLEAEILKKYQRQLPEGIDAAPYSQKSETVCEAQKGQAQTGEAVQEGESPRLYALAETREQWQVLLEYAAVTGIYYSMELLDRTRFLEEAAQVISRTHARGKRCYFAMPYMLREGRLDGMERQFVKLGSLADGFLARNLEEVGYLAALGLLPKTVTDASLYQFNDEAERFFKNLGVKRTTLPLELNGREIRRTLHGDSEMIVYGYYPMMVSAQCVKKTCNRCDKQSEAVELKDRYGQRFLTKSFCGFCYNVIYNCVPTGLLEEAGQIKDMGITMLRMNFTKETPEETRKMLDIFTDAYLPTEKNQKKKSADKIPEFTKGHFKRGVE